VGGIQGRTRCPFAEPLAFDMCIREQHVIDGRIPDHTSEVTCVTSAWTLHMCTSVCVHSGGQDRGITGYLRSTTRR
jgi:hypothetical protein